MRSTLLAALAVLLPAAARAVPNDLASRMSAIALQAGMAGAALEPVQVSRAALSEASRAEALFVASSTETIFKQLEALYAQGALPSKAELSGWFSGRCYDLPSPNKPVGVLLAGVLNAGDNGPLFPPNLELRLGLVGAAGPSDYDELTPVEEKQVAKILESELPKAIVAREKEGALAMTYNSFENRVRRYGTYFIARGAVKQAPNMFCYFFKKVK